MNQYIENLIIMWKRKLKSNPQFPSLLGVGNVTADNMGSIKTPIKLINFLNLSYQNFWKYLMQ